MSNLIIIPNKTFIQDFEDYIRSMLQWISKLITNFTINPLSETLLHYMQQ